MTTLSPDEYISALKHVRMIENVDVASAALFIYDYIITFGMEVDFMWMSPWNFVKILYLVQRYMPFLDAAVFPLVFHLAPNLSRQFCHVGYNFSGWMFVAGVAISESILTLRTWAVWQKDRRLSYALPIFYVLCWAPCFALMGLFLHSMKFAPSDCLITSANSVLYMCWISLMVYEAGILMLMLIPGITAYRTGGDTALFRVVYADGVLYYVYLFILSSLNVAVILTLPGDCATLLSSLERVVHSVLTSRVILDIRALRANPDPDWYLSTATVPVWQNDEPVGSQRTTAASHC